jgi:hypothetical protein
LVLLGFVAVMVAVAGWVKQGPELRGMHHPALHGEPQDTPVSEEERCRVPDFAKAMGHETIWKQHNGCL